MSKESDYGTKLLNQIEENDNDASVARFVLSYGVKLSRNRVNNWEARLGDPHKDGVVFEEKTPKAAVERMAFYICKGE